MAYLLERETLELRLGVLGGRASGGDDLPSPPHPLQGDGMTVPIPLQGDGMTVPIPLEGGISIPTPHQGGLSIPTPLQNGPSIPIPPHAFGDDLPLPPPPFRGEDLTILYGGISIPTP